MALWKKPSGLEIETNDMPETLAYCKSLGWKPKKGRKTADPVEDEPDPVEPDPVEPEEAA